MLKNELDSKNLGDSDVITRQYFDSLLFEMRLIDSVLPSTSMKLFGETFQTPIMASPLGGLKNNLSEMAIGVRESGTIMWTGCKTEEELKEITNTGVKTIKVIKPYEDKDLIFRALEHAKKCGVLAVGMDIDHSFSKTGQYDVNAGIQLKSKTVKELSEIVMAIDLPFIAKGVLSVQDAVKCLEAGVKGIMISHHHGIMDYSAPPLMMLPEIAKEVNGSIPIFVDCGITRGMDAFKALALGANAVGVSRALLEPCRAGRADGVQKAIESMTQELAGVMARTSSRDIEHIDPTVIHKKTW